jgi:ankyrin repeat protein
MDMLSIQSDSFVYDGFEAKCNFDNAHFILSGDSDNLLVRASRRGRINSVRYLLDVGADANECNRNSTNHRRIQRLRFHL